MTRRSPRKIITRVIVFLLLGAIVNVAVAWGIAVSPLMPEALGGRRFVFKSAAMGTWEYLQANSVGASSVCLGFPIGLNYFPVFPVQGEKRMPSWVSLTPEDVVEYLEDPVPRYSGMELRAAGWPLLATQYRFRFEVGSYRRRSNLVVDALQIPRGSRSRDSWILPTRPIWPGLTINTLFYAAILWALFAMPAALRRKRRIKRGLCVKCGYDLRGSSAASACPECGTPLLPAAGAT